jgi:hypothetical protein
MVFRVLKEMNGEKAPSQDGFHVRFSDLCRRVVREDVMSSNSIPISSCEHWEL